MLLSLIEAESIKAKKVKGKKWYANQPSEQNSRQSNKTHMEHSKQLLLNQSDCLDVLAMPNHDNLFHSHRTGAIDRPVIKALPGVQLALLFLL